MGFLDIYPRQQERAAKFQPYESTRLPGYYDPHQQEFLIACAIIVVAVAILIAAFRYRIYLRGSLIIVLAGLLTLCRKTATKARLFWSEVENKADEPL
jgi:Flp pilus assembly protein TadB